MVPSQELKLAVECRVIPSTVYRAEGADRSNLAKEWCIKR